MAKIVFSKKFEKSKLSDRLVYCRLLLFFSFTENLDDSQYEILITFLCVTNLMYIPLPMFF